MCNIKVERGRAVVSNNTHYKVYHHHETYQSSFGPAENQRTLSYHIHTYSVLNITIVDHVCPKGRIYTIVPSSGR